MKKIINLEVVINLSKVGWLEGFVRFDIEEFLMTAFPSDRIKGYWENDALVDTENNHLIAKVVIPYETVLEVKKYYPNSQIDLRPLTGFN